MNKITATNNNKTKKSLCIHNEEGLVTKDSDVADIFNNFFVNIGNKIQSEIQQNHQNMIDPNNKSLHSIFLRPLAKNELIKHIKSLKKYSSPGEDGITVSLIQQMHSFLLKPLLHIINICFESFDIPDEWKVSLVTPAFKSSDPTHLTNYRPISIINNIATNFKKCLRQRLVEFLEQKIFYILNSLVFEIEKILRMPSLS